jgi:hypothetical protein
MTDSTLDRALAEAAHDEIARDGGTVSVDSIAAYMAHRDLLDDEFWSAWDAAVRNVRNAYASRSCE